MTTGIVHELNLEKQIEKQMGCMTGFLQLFDRNQILSGKRLYSTKRLPPPPAVDATSEPETLAVVSPANLREPGKAKQLTPPSPERLKQWPVADFPSKSPLPFPMFELKEGTKSSWKLCKETPRLSLDSRATTDAKGGLHPKEILLNASTIPAANGVVHDAVGSQLQRSPSVIAKLMGLEPLPNSSTTPEPEKKAELRRSSSESRGLLHSRLIMEGNNFYLKQPSQSHSSIFNNALKESAALEDTHYEGSRNYLLKNRNKAEPPKILSSTGGVNLSPWKVPQHRRSYFDSAEIFPEPKQNVPIYGEIERRLKMRGIEEPSKDLETLKNILEALQLKGLLHPSSTKPSEQNKIPHTNFVYDESPIVLMKPSLSTMTSPVHRRTENEFSPSNGRSQSRGVRRNYNTAIENSSPLIPRHERNVQNPSESECNSSARRSNSQVKPKLLSVETHRRANELIDNRRASPVHSPKLNTRRIVLEPPGNNRHPRSKKTMVKDHEKDNIAILVPAENESSSISGSSISTSTDTERPKTEYKEGKTLLERCDKLLHSIAEMTTAIEMQPSPVSVLDSSLYKDDSFIPSPITAKHNINLKDQSANLEEELWSSVTSPIGLKCCEISEDSDFHYISDILSASHLFPDESDIFLLLEKQQYLKGKDSSKLSRLQRKLIFDTINEILNRIRRLPPWRIISWTNYDVKSPPVYRIWLEFQRIREQDAAEDLFETVCCVLKKDLAGDTITGWGDCPIEMSEAVLDIERLIFKDLITETIRDLAALASGRTFSMMARRKLVF